MPTEAYKLIPMEIFPNMTLEFQMSPWAFFTSGYCTSTTNSLINQPKRQYRVTRFELVTDQYVFEPAINSVILEQFKAGANLFFHSHSFRLGPTYNISKNQIPGVIQINMGFDSLKAVLIIFLARDYEIYTWCRR